MIDKRIGKRIKECREKLGLTQDQFSEKIGLSVNYISTVERGGSFPRYEKLIKIISRRLSGLPTEEQNRILEMLDLMIQQAESNK